jgi:hypothetical protein
MDKDLNRKDGRRMPGTAPWRWWGLRRYYPLLQEPEQRSQPRLTDKR